MSSRTSSTPPRTVEQFCAQHNMTFTPSIAKMTLAELSHLYASQRYEPQGNQPDPVREDTEHDGSDDNMSEVRRMEWDEYFRHLQSKALAERFLWQREDQAVRDWQAMQGKPVTHKFRHVENSLATQLRALIKDRELNGMGVPQIMRDRLAQEEQA